MSISSSSLKVYVADTHANIQTDACLTDFRIQICIHIRI